MILQPVVSRRGRPGISKRVVVVGMKRKMIILMILVLRFTVLLYELGRTLDRS